MTTIRHCSINSAKIYFSSVLITSRFRVLILGKLFANNIYALFICKIQDKRIITSFSLLHCSKCQALGTSSCSVNFSDWSKHQHGAKLGSDGSSDDWWLLDGFRLTHILLDTHLKWGTLLTLLCISIYSIFGLMWFATRWNKCKLSEASRIIADVKQELLTPPFNFSADTSELDSSVHQSHFSAMLFLQMDNLLGEVIFHYLLSLWLSVDFLLFHHRFIISCIACNLLNSDLITAIAHSFQPFVNFEVTKM